MLHTATKKPAEFPTGFSEGLGPRGFLVYSHRCNEGIGPFNVDFRPAPATACCSDSYKDFVPEVENGLPFSGNEICEKVTGRREEGQVALKGPLCFRQALPKPCCL